MFKPLAVISALLIGTASLAHADTINGVFSVFGADSFTSTAVTFGAATVQPAITGSLATYIKANDPITFLSEPGGLPYHVGVNIPPNPPFPNNTVPIFTIAGFSGETFTFNMTQYTATYDTVSPACSAGQVCLDLSIQGDLTATGPFALGTSGPATGTTSLQYANLHPARYSVDLLRPGDRCSPCSYT